MTIDEARDELIARVQAAVQAASAASPLLHLDDSRRDRLTWERATHAAKRYMQIALPPAVVDPGGGRPSDVATQYGLLFGQQPAAGSYAEELDARRVVSLEHAAEAVVAWLVQWVDLAELDRRRSPR